MRPVLLLFTAALAACDNGGREAMLENYVVRLGRAVDEQAAALHPATLPSRPAVGDRYPTHLDARIDLLEFLKLRSCRLQATIAQRNSSLGKLAPPSQRLLNSVEFLRWVEPCISRMSEQGHRDIAGQLRRVAEQKTAQLPYLLWRVILGAEEARLFWKRPPSLDNYPEYTGVALLDTLEQLHRLGSAWLAGDYAVSAQALEDQLQALSQGDGGAMLAAMQLLSEQMKRADTIIIQSQQRGPLCPAGRPTERGQILDNVVRLFLIGEVQVWSADLNRRYYALWPALQRLEQLLEAGEPAEYRRWRGERDRAMEQFRATPRKHIKLLMPILRGCALAPSRPSATTTPIS